MFTWNKGEPLTSKHQYLIHLDLLRSIYEMLNLKNIHRKTLLTKMGRRD